MVKYKPAMKSCVGDWSICCEQKNCSPYDRLYPTLNNYIQSRLQNEYTISLGIKNEPAFSWWVHHVLKKSNRIIFFLERVVINGYSDSKPNNLNHTAQCLVNKLGHKIKIDNHSSKLNITLSWKQIS